MKVINSNRFYFPGTTALHLASIQDGLKEYICFYLDGKIYIEEITGGHLEFIEDDNLAEELLNFLTLQKILDPTKPLLTDKQWYNLGRIK